ncbi:MAG: hypothetical protein WD357_03890 [Gracilimonas sp.]
MIEINRILIQLDSAVNCANSPYPQKKSIAVILFDNLIEVQLYKRAENSFIWDRTTWYNGSRFHDSRTRNKALSYYDNLLKFSKDNKVINQSDFEILKYAHSIRNSVYHKGDLNELKIELALLIYYDFTKNTLLKWGSPNSLIGYTNLPGYEKIDFGQGLSDEVLPEHEKYFESALNTILGKLKMTENLTKTIQRILRKQIERIEWSIEFISKESKTINFYDVLGRFWYLNSDFFEYYKDGRKPKNLDSILLLYGFLREHQDYLDDIHDLKIRQQKGKKLLRQYRANKNGKYPHWTNLDRIKSRINSMKDNEPEKSLKNLMDIESKIAHLYTDLDEASSDLDGYIMELVDRAKGK